MRPPSAIVGPHNAPVLFVDFWGKWKFVDDFIHFAPGTFSIPLAIQ
jgi:hypothetical protein